MMPLFHFKGTLNHSEGIRDPPVASGVHPDVFHSKGFEDVDRPGRRALRFRVKGHPSPIALIKDEGGRMLFNVVNDDAATIYVGVVESVDNKARAFKFVLKMGGMNENGLIVFFGNFHVLFKDGELVLGVFIKPNFTNPKNCRLVDKIRNKGHYLTCKDRVLGFLWVDAEPAEMLDAEFSGAGSRWVAAQRQ